MNYQKIYEFDLANGPGVRISLFVSGCGIRCPGCFNKEAWDFCSGKPFGSKEIKAIKKLLRDSRYDGFSILGGEPFDQDNKSLKQMYRLCKYAKRHKKNVWIWTGHLATDFNKKWQKKLCSQCDALVEGPFIETLKTDELAFRGSINQNILHF